RGLAAAAARALRVAVGQPNFERKIRPKKVWKIGAVGANDHSRLVLAQAQMVEQDIARSIAQHFMQRLPRWRRVERCIEQLLDPCRIQVFGRAIPCIAHRPEASVALARAWRLAALDCDLTGNRAALDRCTIARERRAPGSRGWRGDLGEPEIRRPALPVTRRGRDASIGPDQRKLTFKGLLSREDDAQRRPLPRRYRG